MTDTPRRKQPTSKPLTVREQEWIARVNKILAACPSDRLGFYTSGDRDVSIYDKRFDAFLDESVDFGPAVEKVDAGLGALIFPSNVHSTSA